MSRWKIVLVSLFAVGAVIAVVGERLGREQVTFAGIGAIGLVGLLIGVEVIVSRRLVTVSRYDRRTSETWLGAAAVGQGVIIASTGVFLVGVAAVAIADRGREVVTHFARRPGLPLLAFAALCFAAAAMAIGGSVEEKQGARWLVWLNLAASRLLPGAILLALGLGASALGLLEVVAPATFDRLGGGFLEVLFAAAP